MTPRELGGDKLGEYVAGAGLKFSSQELKRQSSQLTDLLRARPELLAYLSEAFGEELSLGSEAQKL